LEFSQRDAVNGVDYESVSVISELDCTNRNHNRVDRRLYSELGFLTITD